MALRAAQLEVLFTANTTDVEKAEKTVKSTGERIEKKPIIAKVDADAKGALAGMDRVETAAKKLVSNDTAIKLDADISRAEKSLDRAKQRMADLEVRALGGLDVTADTRRAEAALSKIERNLAGLRSARTQIEIDADTKPAEDALDSVSEDAGEAGDDAGAEFGENIIAALVSIPIAGAVVGIGAAAAKALVDAFNDGLQQEQSVDRLQALTGIGEADALRLGRAAGEAYANTFGDSIEANMDTTRLALQFGIVDEESTTRSAQRVVEGLSGIASVLGEDVRPVATAVTQLLRTGLASSADEAFDILASGAVKGVNASEDMLDTFTEYPALFARLGLTGKEALGLLNQGLEGGARNSDLAADALKEFQIRATDASELSAQGFEALGLNAEEMTAKIAAGGAGAREGLDQVLDGLRAMEDPVARNAAAVALFGTQAEDLGEALFEMDLSTAVEQLGGVEGAARRLFDTLADNDATRMEQARRNIDVAVQGIQGALAAAFSEPLGEFADWVSQNRGPLLEFFQGLVNSAIDFGHSLIDAAADGTEAFGEFVSGPLAGLVEGVAGVMKAFNWGDDKGLGELAEGMRGFKDETSVAADNIRGLHDGLDEASGRFNGFMDGAVAMGYLNDASLRLAESIDQVGYGADGAKLSLEGVDLANVRASESGRTLEDQVRGAIAALSDEVAAAEASGEAQEALTERYDAGTQALVDQLTQMGLTEEQARALIETVLQTPASATTAFSSNAQEQQGRVQSLADRIKTLPNGDIVVVADTSPADDAMSRFFRNWNGSTVAVNVNAKEGRNYAKGAVVEFMAAGGLTPMQSIAQMVPANTWRVVGDRGDVPELFAPLDGSARSWALLLEGFRRMPGSPPAEFMEAGGVSTSAQPPTLEGLTITGVLEIGGDGLARLVNGLIVADGRARSTVKTLGRRPNR